MYGWHASSSSRKLEPAPLTLSLDKSVRHERDVLAPVNRLRACGGGSLGDISRQASRHRTGLRGEVNSHSRQVGVYIK